MNREEFEAAVTELKTRLEEVGLSEDLALEKAVDAAVFGKQKVEVEMEVDASDHVGDRCDLEELAEEYGVRSDHTDSSEVAAEIYRELLKEL